MYIFSIARRAGRGTNIPWFWISRMLWWELWSQEVSGCYMLQLSIGDEAGVNTRSVVSELIWGRERAESHSFRFFDLFNNQIITKMSRKTLKQQPKLLEQVFFILLLFRWDWDGWLKQLQMDQIFSNFLRRTKRTAKKFRKLIWANKKN